MKLIPRHLANRITEVLTFNRIVNIVGPRQAGKTTLVKDLIESETYLTIEDPVTRQRLESDPFGELLALSAKARGSGKPVIIDEVQLLPEITFALKRVVDTHSDPGQFILTGSSNIFTSGKAYDSLAGRTMTLTLRPLSAAEIEGKGPCRLLDVVEEFQKETRRNLPEPEPFTRSQVVDLIIRGGFPKFRTLNGRNRIDRYLSYLDSIVERDVAPIAEVRKPDTLRKLIDQVAVRTAEETTTSELCNAVAARRETVDDYLDILSRLGIVQRLGAWTSSGGKREIRAPKIHFLDTGCATALRVEDETSFEPGANPVALGHLLESFVFIELEKSLPYLNRRWRLYHWRDNRREIDLLAEAPGRMLALFEMKAAVNVKLEDFQHINWFLTEGPGKSYKGVGFLVYLGKDLVSFGEGRIVLPLSMFWSFAKRTM